MPVLNGVDSEKEALVQLAKMILVSARTAPKSKGLDTVQTALVTGKEKDAIALAVSGIAKKYNVNPEIIKTLETKYHSEAGDWYVALGWDNKKSIVQMDSVLATIIDIKEI